MTERTETTRGLSEPASIGLRFGAYVIDFFSVGVCFVIFGLAIMIGIPAPTIVSSEETVVEFDEWVDEDGWRHRESVVDVTVTYENGATSTVRQEVSYAVKGNTTRRYELSLPYSSTGDVPFDFQALAAYVFLSLIFLYFPVSEASRFQGTLGKHALGLKVTDYQGNRVGFFRALGRTLGKVVSVGFYVGALAALWSDRRRCWHDSWSKCEVVMR